MEGERARKIAKTRLHTPADCVLYCIMFVCLQCSRHRGYIILRRSEEHVCLCNILLVYYARHIIPIYNCDIEIVLFLLKINLRR